jgi:hypothetical protein
MPALCRAVTAEQEAAADVGQFIINAGPTAIGVAASYATGSDYCAFKDHLIIECYPNDLLPHRSTITIGNSVTTSLSEQEYEDDPYLRAHENAHTRQWMIPGFVQMYIAESLRSLAKTGHPACANIFERAAGWTPGYAEICGWAEP